MEEIQKLVVVDNKNQIKISDIITGADLDSVQSQHNIGDIKIDSLGTRIVTVSENGIFVEVFTISDKQQSFEPVL